MDGWMEDEAKERDECIKEVKEKCVNAWKGW